MKTVKVTINGKEIITEANKTILEVIHEHKLDNIPNLCYDPKLPPYGSCYLCVVEVEGLQKLVPSCCNPISDGMVIHTDNEKIRSSRKMALELLLSNHYADCIAPCRNTCPAGVDIQGYIGLISMGKHKEAVRLIKQTNPLPLVCGRVCVRECELSCRRNRIDEAVGIDYLKRYTSDIDIKDPWTPSVAERNGKKVAIIGGGPSGLTCAYYLILKGYSVTIFEKHNRPGGMLLWGIPEYRLPKKVLAREIKWITDLGVEVKTNTAIGRDFTIDTLFKNGYNAIYLAMGAQGANKMRVPEEDTTEGVISGIDFLYNSQIEGKVNIYGTIVVIGGGNTAIDAARTALRYGAKKVILLYRRTRQEMPAHSMEIDAALLEGVEIVYLSVPQKIIKDSRRLKALECIKMRLGEPDASGRRRPVPIEGSEYTIECDFVISAIGQQVELDGLEKEERLALTKWKTVVYNKDTFETSIKGVFAGGDFATGPATAIDAIAHGKLSGEAIDEYIKTGTVTPKKKEFISRKDVFGEISDEEFIGYEKLKREIMAELPPLERIKTFKEVELGFSDKQSINEAERCLACGCSALFDCKLKKYATEYEIDISKYLGEVRKYKVDKTHPFIVLDPNKCISCGKCVRTCSDILNVSALGFVYRGFKSIVKPAMEKKLLETNCITCGNCIAACPTGAITEKLPFKQHGPWQGEKIPFICSFCSVGCSLNFNVISDNIFSVLNASDDTHNQGYLCVKGRFGYRYLLDNNRLLKPMIKDKGELKDSTWDKALKLTTERIKKIIHTYGPDSIAIFGSPRMTNEELYLLQKFARAGLKTNNIHNFTHLLNGIELDSLDESFGMTVSSATMDDLDGANIILVINADLSTENLIMELKIKKSQKKGTKLVFINSSETNFTKFSDLWIDSRRGTNTVLLNGLINALLEKCKIDTEFIQNRTEGFEEFKDSISQFNTEYISEVTGVQKDKLLMLYDLIGNKDLNLIVVYNIDSHKEKARNDLRAIGNLLMLTGRVGKEGQGLIILRDYANSAGLLDMGINPDYLPGYVRYKDTEKINEISKYWNVELKEIFKPVDLLKKLKNDEIKGLLIFGENPIVESKNLKYFRGLEFLMVQDIFFTTTAREADVVLPASTYIETEGTFTSCDRRVQKFNKIFTPASNLENWEIIKKLWENLDVNLPYSSPADIFNEIKKVNSLYRDVEFGQIWGKKLFKKTFPTPSKKGKFLIYDTDISSISPKKPEYLSHEEYFKLNIRRKLMI